MEIRTIEKSAVHPNHDVLEVQDDDYRVIVIRRIKVPVLIKLLSKARHRRMITKFGRVEYPDKITEADL